MNIEFTVRPLAEDASGYGVVAVSDALIDRLGIAVDDFVGVAAGDATVKRAVRVATEDETDHIGIDDRTRSELGVEIGDAVTVTPLSVPTGHEIHVTSAEDLSDVDPQDLRFRLAHRVVSAGQELSVPVQSSGREMAVVDIEITHTVPSGTVGTDTSTTIEVEGVSEHDSPVANPVGKAAAENEGITFDQVGGLDEAIEKVREVVERPLTNPDLFDALGAEPPTGVLLHGPPGTGKTLLARAVANEADAHFVQLSASAVFSKWVGETEENIREVFQEARNNAPSIVYIDEIDGLATERGSGKSWEARAVTELLTQLDGLEQDEQVITLAATNRIDALDPALRRPGRFDREVEIGRPDASGRHEILQIHTRDVPLSSHVDLEDLATQTTGYTGADLEALVSEAVTATVRRVYDGERPSPMVEDSDSMQVQLDGGVTVTPADIEAGLDATEPNGLREYDIDVPETEWDDIGGLGGAKEIIKQEVVWPQRHAQLYEQMELDPGAGILLHGPPGTGKTLLARAAANATAATVLPVAGPELVGSRPGDTEAAIQQVFQRARDHAPCIVILDEVDALAPARDSPASTPRTDRAVAQLLTELDGLSTRGDVTAIATTNRPESIDTALTRPGRFETEIRVGRPDVSARADILAVHLRDRPVADTVDPERIADQTDGYTGADLAAVCQAAAQHAIERAVQDMSLGGTNQTAESAIEITSDNMAQALGSVRSERCSVSGPEDINRAFN